MSILETLATLEAAAETDDAFILAAAINIYSESIRRREGRILYGPADVKALFTICTHLMSPKAPEQSFIANSRRATPTADEEEHITDVYSAINEMAKLGEAKPGRRI